MNRPQRLLLAVAVGTGIVGTLVSGCKRGTAPGSIGGPVKVEHVIKRGLGVYPAPYLTERNFLRIHTTPSFEEPILFQDELAGSVDCHHLDLAEDSAGTNVAFRCQGQKSWSVIRLLGGDRHLMECDATVGSGPTPDFTRLSSLRDAAPRIMECVERRYGAPTERVWLELVRSVYEREGDAAVSAVIVETGKSWRGAPPGMYWSGGLDALPPPARAKALAAVCASLGGTDAYPLYRRAAELCDLAAPAVGDGALRELRTVLGIHANWSQAVVTFEEATDAGVMKTWSQTQFAEIVDALAWAAPIAAKHHPREAGAVACETLSRGRERSLLFVDDRAILVANVLAATGHRCPPVGDWLPGAPCGNKARCDGHVCTAAELDVESSRWKGVETAPRKAEAKPPPPLPIERAVLRALHALGPLPGATSTVEARFHYAADVQGGCDPANRYFRGGRVREDLSDDDEGLFCHPFGKELEVRKTFGFLVGPMAVAPKTRTCEALFDDAHRRVVVRPTRDPDAGDD